MKYGTLIIILTIFYSCQTKQDSTDNEDSRLRPDTISIIQKRYSLPDEIPEVFEYKLIKESKGDSLLSFRYYQDTTLSRQYDFIIRQGQFQLLQDTTDIEHLVPVDTFSIQLMGDQLTVYKYEKYLPPIDGDIGYLFNEKYGLLGYSAYSWGNKTVLTNWDDINFEKEITEILFADNVRYLNRQKIIPPPPPPPPPGQFRKTEIVEDTVEIEDELEIK